MKHYLVVSIMFAVVFFLIVFIFNANKEELAKWAAQNAQEITHHPKLKECAEKLDMQAKVKDIVKYMNE